MDAPPTRLLRAVTVFAFQYSTVGLPTSHTSRTNYTPHTTNYTYPTRREGLRERATLERDIAVFDLDKMENARLPRYDTADA